MGVEERRVRKRAARKISNLANNKTKRLDDLQSLLFCTSLVPLPAVKYQERKWTKTCDVNSSYLLL